MKKNYFIILCIIILCFMFTGCKKKSYCEKNGHDFSNATCLMPEKCVECGKEGNPALGHEYSEPTCVDDSVCIRCNDVLEYAHGHEYTELTCTEDSICKKCNEINLKAKGHNVVIDQAVEATCEKEGMTEGSHCSLCNEVLNKQEVINKKEHTFTDWRLNVSPNENTDGSWIRNCDSCKKTETKVLTYAEVIETINNAYAQVNIPKEITGDIEIVKAVGDVKISWKSSNSYLLTASGEVKSRGTTSKKVSLYATYSYLGVKYDVEYVVTILGYTDEERINMAAEKVSIPEIVSGNIDFVTSLSYKVKATYTSSNPEVISNDGKLTPQSEDITITITVLFSLGEATMEKSFDVLVKKYNPEEKMHQLTIYSKDLDLSNQEGLIINNNRIELAQGVSEATYYSKEYDTMGFYCLVGSWAAISNENATCELKVSVRVDDAWSDYISYGKWGLGLQNALYDQSNDLIKLSVDEVMVLNNKLANAIKYSITLRRTNETFESPKLSLVSFALQADNHSHYIDKSLLPEYVNYEVPQLNQNIVPGIGNIICSATSSTMLLKYYGFNFSDKDAEYEHRYVASLVKDYGNNIYGNWVYNTATISAYGLNSYLARMYSLEELMYHLANVGPVSLTVRGTMTSNVASYTTNGHLIVCTGYKYVDGELVFLCNDPNVKVVACEYTETVMKATWRNVAYVIE